MKMADNNDDDFIRGETLEVLLDLLDEDLLDEMFQDEINVAVEEINVPGKTTNGFSCEVCGKIYKTKGGLNRHTRKKHSPSDSSEVNGTATIILTPATIVDIVKKSKDELHQNVCYPQFMRDIVADYQFQLNEGLRYELEIAFGILKKYADGEKFYSFFYGKILKNASTFFPNLQPPMSTLLAKKLADNILHFFKKQKQLPCSKPCEPISAKEMDGLQYFSGYVVIKFLKKTRNSSNYKSESSQALIAVLSNFVEEDNTSQRLIASQTRGGLTAVKKEIQKIFLCAEEVFRAHTSTSSHVRKIDLQAMVNQLLMDTVVISMYNSLVETATLQLHSELRKNLLENMLKLYLRVRAFSFARDITGKHKYACKKSKTKALRKDIKKATDKPDISQ